MDFRADPQFGNITSALEQSRGLPAGLLSALVGSESSGNPNAVSSAGAQGLTQFMPATAKQYNVNVSDPVDSLRGTADYLQDLLHQYGGNVKAALAHYNGGAHNAQFQVDGSVPSPQQVSPQNFQTNQNYVNGIMAKLPTDQVAAATGPTVEQVNATVAGMAAQGASPASIFNALLKHPVTAEVVKQGQAAGDSINQIVTKLGGPALAAVQSANDKVNNQNFLQNAGQGASNAGSDMLLGAKQMLARSGSADEAALRAEAAKREADPERLALTNTVGGTIGGGAVKAAPYVAGALLAPEAVIPQMLVGSAIGAGQGALTPTTADGQRLGNIATEAGLGAAGAGGGALLGKGISGLAAKALGTTPEDAARIAQLTADAKAQGLPVNAATLSKPDSFLRNLAEGSSATSAFQQKADAAIAGKVADGLGLTGYAGPIDTDMLQAAKPGIKQALDQATAVQVVLPRTLQQDLAPIVAGTQNPLTVGIASNSTVKQAAENLLAAAKAGNPVSGVQLQELNSELKALTQNASASAGERVAAGKLIGKVNDALTSAMTPEQQAAYAAANRQYANMMAVQKMVSASGDTGAVTPRQMINAVKTGRFKNAFYNGDAPYQELAGTAADLYGPSSGKGLGSLLAKHIGSHDSSGAILAEMAFPHAGIPSLIAKKAVGALMNKAATSENPMVVNLLTGNTKAGQALSNPVLRQFIAKALSGSGSAGANSFE